MLQPATIKFLKDLKKNNNKPWFDANRKLYEAAKADFEAFVSQVLQKLATSDESLAHLKSKDCTFRINRDVRFAKDKSPYKNHMAMYISKDGKNTRDAGYYLHCEPGAAFIAGGVWMPPSPELKKIRQEIDYNLDEFEKIIHNKKIKDVFNGFDTAGDAKLSRPPKGYDDENPAIEYLKLKSFIISKKLDDETLTSKTLVKQVTDDIAALRPFIAFLNHAMAED